MAITHSSGTITIDSGRTASTATGGGTATLTDTGQSWTTNAETGYVVYIHTGTGSGQYALIASNTATVLTISRSWTYNFTTGVVNVTASDWVTQPDNTSQYVILYRWSDVQAADTTGGWGVVTTQGNQIRISGDIQWGGGTNYGGLWDYEKYIEVIWPSATAYQVDRWLMSNNAIWGDGLPDDNAEPTQGGIYHFDASNLNTTGVDLINGAFTGTNYACHINMFDTVWKATTYSTPQQWIFVRMKSNSTVAMKSMKSLNGPAGRWASSNTIVEGATFHDCINDWALTGSPTDPLSDVVIYNAGAGAQVSDPGADYDTWKWFNNTDVISMGGFTTGNTFYITDCVMAKDGSVGLLTQSDISCSSSLGNAAASGQLIERKRVSYNVVDSAGTAINGARVAFYNTSGTEQFNVTTDSNGDTTTTKVNVQLWQGSSNPGVNDVPPNAATVYNPMTLKIRDYDYNFLEETFTLEFPITLQSKALSANSFVVASQATAAAYSGISINHGTGTVTISQGRTIQELYDHHVNDLCASGNIQYDDWFTTADGITFTSTYDIVVTGGSGSLSDETKTIALSGGATLTTASGGFFEDSNGAQWESGGSVYYASHVYLEANIDGTSTAIQNAIFSVYETDTDTNVTYNTSLSQTGLTSDANGQIEGYIVYRVDSTTYGGHTLVIGEYDYQWATIPVTINGSPLGSSGGYSIYFLRADSNVTKTKANALAVSGVTVTYSTADLSTTATAADTYDNLKARQARYTDIDTGTPGINSYYEVSLYNGGDGHILAHTGSAHVLADTWDFSIASDYGYPLSLDNSTLSLTATGTYTDLTLTSNSTVEFEAAGNYTMSSNVTVTTGTTFDNLTASTVTAFLDPASPTPTTASTGGGTMTIDQTLQIDVDDSGTLPDGTRVRLYNTTASGVSAWQASTAYVVGDRVLRTTGLGTELNGGVYFYCSTAGTSGGTEPTWDVAAAGNTTTDNTVTWTVYPVEIDNSLVSGGGGYSYTLTSGQDYVIGDTLTLYYAYVSGSSAAYLPDSQGFVASSTDVSLIITTANDTVYTGYAVDGSGVTEYAADYPNVEVDVNAAGNQFQIARFYAWWAYNLTTANGIRNFWNGVEAINAAQIQINNSIIDLYFDNVNSTSAVQTDNIRVYRVDGAYPQVTSTSGGGGLGFYATGTIYTTTVQVSGATVGQIADAVWDEALSGHTSSGSTGEKLDRTPTKSNLLTSKY